jgi:hypothetical protein
MPYAHPEALVSSDWLASHLADPHVRVVDSSFKLPGISPTAREDYARGHLPGAVFFDIDDICEPCTSLPHMIPSPGLCPADGALRHRGRYRVVVYDGAVLGRAPCGCCASSASRRRSSAGAGWKAEGGYWTRRSRRAAEHLHRRPTLLRGTRQHRQPRAGGEQVLDARAGASTAPCGSPARAA